MQTPLQGLPLVAHGGKIYRVGGLNARNATTDDKEDLHSTTEFAVFDPATRQVDRARAAAGAAFVAQRGRDWRQAVRRRRLDAHRLAEGRVARRFAGVRLRRSDARAGRSCRSRISKRRALAASQWHGKLAALGGMDEKAEISRRVDFFDPATGKWSQGPDLPGTGMSGFGVSAWNLDGNVYVSGFNGRVFKLADDGSKWEEVAKLEQPRFFHQLVPAAKADALLVVGGASSDGHLDDVELVDVGATIRKVPPPTRTTRNGPPTPAPIIRTALPADKS